MIVVVMGVSGSGKSTVGRMLAQRLDCIFYDGDDFHPPENIEKMARGTALSDEDRSPWFERLNRLMDQCRLDGLNAVLACSALRESYRTLLGEGADDVCFVYLKGSYETIHERMQGRGSHFMKESMLKSQYACLEEPQEAIVVDIEDPPRVLVEKIEVQLKRIV